MLFAVVDAVEADCGPVWFVPSHEFSHHGLRTGGGMLRFSASAKSDTQDKWRKHRLEKRELAPAILHHLTEI